MHVTEVPDVTLADLVAASNPDRSPGLHQSDIIKDVMQTLEPERFTGSGIDPGSVVVGIAFEELLANTLRDLLPGWEKPGEFRRDGIILSPDGFGGTGFEGIEEIKTTWVSMREGLNHPKLAHYHVQAKGYCHALGVNRAKFRVLFVNGDYAARRWPPVLRTFVVCYTDEELEANWAMITQHAKDRGLQ